MVFNKSHKLDRVYAEVLKQCLNSFGQPKVNKLKVANKAKVSRPWIYKYCGRTDKELIANAFESYAKFFARVGQSKRPMHWTKKMWHDNFLAGFQEMLDDAQALSWLMPFYYRFKGSENDIGRMISAYEEFYSKHIEGPRLQEVFKFNKEQSLLMSGLLISIRMGICHHWSSDPDKSQKKKKFYLNTLRILTVQALKRPNT